ATARSRLRTAQARFRRRPVGFERAPGKFPGVFVGGLRDAMLGASRTEAGMKRRTALVGSLAALAGARSARAETAVDLQLVMAVDVSRSIDEVEAELQRRGYIEAMVNERVVDAILSGEHRRIAVCYLEWAGTHYQTVVIDWTVIDSMAAARRFSDKLTEAPRTSQSWTAVGAALAFSAQRFENTGYAGKRRVIDISGDGRTNDGPPAEMVR